MLALMQAQIKQGLSISALVHHHKTGRPFLNSKEGGANIYRVPIIAKLFFVPIALSAYWHLKAILEKEQPDVIHAHLPNATCFWLLFLKKASNRKLVLHWHSDVIGDKPNWGIKCLYPVYRIFEKVLLVRAERIIVTSENYLHSSKPLEHFRNKCVVVPLGLEDITDEPVTDSSFDVGALCVGRLTYYKGHKYLIKAMAKIDDEKLVLTIVGEGDERNKLEAMVRELGLTDKVRFLGQVSDEMLYSLIVHCRFLVLPSIERTEAFGLVLLEAMRAGKACICTDVTGSGMSNVVEHEKTGIVVKHANTEALTQALLQLSENEEQTSKLGKNGRMRFLTQFKVDEIEKLVRAIYQGKK